MTVTSSTGWLTLIPPDRSTEPGKATVTGDLLVEVLGPFASWSVTMTDTVEEKMVTSVDCDDTAQPQLLKAAHWSWNVYRFRQLTVSTEVGWAKLATQAAMLLLGPSWIVRARFRTIGDETVYERMSLVKDDEATDVKNWPDGSKTGHCPEAGTTQVDSIVHISGCNKRNRNGREVEVGEAEADGEPRKAAPSVRFPPSARRPSPAARLCL